MLVLGGGSNILFTKNFDGIVLKNDIKGVELIKEDAHYVYVKAGAGENWHQFVLYCLQRNWQGIENLSLLITLYSSLNLFVRQSAPFQTTFHWP